MQEPAKRYAEAIDALNRGQWQLALRIGRELLQAAPNHGGVHFVVGVAAHRSGNAKLAIEHLEQATRLSPERADYATQLAVALSDIMLTGESLEAARRAWGLRPADAFSLDTLGVMFTRANAHAEALPAFRAAVAAMPQLASHRFNLATSLAFNGLMDEAEQEYEACIERQPTHWKAHVALAQHRRQTRDRNHLPRLRHLLAEHGGKPDAALHLNLAISKELEDLGDEPAALPHLLAGKAAGRPVDKNHEQRDAALFEALMELFPIPASNAPTGHPSAEPIFVIGMPRSGTTLVERILGSHPAVQGAGELQNFGIRLKRLSGSRTAALLDRDTIERGLQLDAAKLGSEYIASTRPDTGQLPHFIDKLPHNFLNVGFIASALPNARIVCLHRDAMDTCLSNLRQLFAPGNPVYDYSYDLLSTGRYFIRFRSLMEHWLRLLPGRILELDYETLVSDQEAETRRLLAFCRLPWDEACLRFHESTAPVSTASVSQVREGLHRRSIGRWQRYGSGLDELRALLQSAGY